MGAMRLKLYLVGLGLMAACHAADFVDPLPDLSPPPIADVIVYTWPGLVQVGDTLRISAEGFNSSGFGYVQDVPFAWSTPDSLKTITLEKTNNQYPFMHDVLVRGQAVGKATVKATANKLTGSGTVEVIPRIARIDVSPSSATIAVGDSVQFTATAITAAGDTLRGYRPLWHTIPDYSPASLYYPPSAQGINVVLIRGVAVGTAQVTATLAGAVGKAQVAVVAHSP